MSKKAGSFELIDGMLYGPQAYMEAKGDKLLEAIQAGEDAIFNMTCGYSPDLEMAVLVRLQTDYAGWLGMQQTLATLESQRQAQERWSAERPRRPSQREPTAFQERLL